MINKIKYVFWAILISALLPVFAVAAETPQGKAMVNEECSAAFTQDKKVKPESFVVCQQDVALNAMTLSIGSVVQENEVVQSLYKKFGVPIPNYSAIVTYISKPIGAVAAAAVQLCLILISVFAAIRLYMAGSRAMRDAELSKMATDPSTYKSFLGFGLVAVLSYRFGDINVAQILVIGAGLAALTLTTYLFTAMISVFDFTSKQGSLEDSYKEFLPQGEMYANTIISSVYGAQSAVLRSNFMNVTPENANLISEASEGNFFQKALASIFGEFGIYLEEDPTAYEYFDGIFGDAHMTLRQHSGFTYRYSGAYRGATELSTKSVNSSSLTVGDGRASSEESSGVTSPLFEKAYSYSDLFDAATTLTLSSSLPSVEPKVIKHIAKSSLINKLNDLIIDPAGETSDGENNHISSLGADLVLLIKEVIDLYPEVKPIDVVSVFQGIALGSISAEAVQTNKLQITKVFPPFIEASTFNEQYTKEPFHRVISQALSGAKAMRKYDCLRNFADTGGEFQMLYNIYDNGGSWDDKMESAYEGGDIFPICLYPMAGAAKSFDSLAPEKMVAGAKDAVKRINSGISDSGNLGAILSQMQVVANKERLDGSTSGGADSEVSLALVKAQDHISTIAMYYARVAAIGRFAALEFIEHNQEQTKEAFMGNMRRQGALAVSSYFMQLSQEQSKYSEVIYNSEPKTSATSSLFDNTGMPPQTAMATSDERLSEKRSLLPKNGWDLSAHLSTDNPDLAAQSMRGDDPNNDGDALVSEFVAEVADMIIPAQDVLMDGFGMKSDTFIESMESCATTTGCVEFTQHPIATVSLFGKDMLYTGMIIVMVDSFIQAIDKAINGGGESSSADDKKGGGGFLGKIGGFVKKIAAKLMAVGWVIKVIAVISSIFAIFGSVFMFAGMFVGYLVPLMPFVTQVMMWVAWLAEFLILFVIVPLLVAFSFMVREDGTPLFKGTSILSMMAAVVLKAPLIFISFMVFYTLSYAGIYIINSTMFTVFSIDFASGLGPISAILQIMSAVIFFVFVVAMYFLMFKNLTKLMSELPEYALRPMGIQSLNIQVNAGVESFIMTSAINRELQKTIKATASGTVSSTKAIGGKLIQISDRPPVPPKDSSESGGDTKKGSPERSGSDIQSSGSNDASSASGSTKEASPREQSSDAPPKEQQGSSDKPSNTSKGGHPDDNPDSTDSSSDKK